MELGLFDLENVWGGNFSFCQRAIFKSLACAQPARPARGSVARILGAQLAPHPIAARSRKGNGNGLSSRAERGAQCSGVSQEMVPRSATLSPEPWP